MAHRIAVRAVVTDARAQSYLHTLQTLFPRAKLKSVAVAQAYTIDAKLTSPALKQAAERLTNPTTEMFSTATVPAPKAYQYAIEIGFHPGVTDNVGRTARETIADSTRRTFKGGEGVYTSVFLFLNGSLSEKEVWNMAKELHNPLIERATVYKKGEKLRTIVPKVRLGASSRRTDLVNLDVQDEELSVIGKQGVADRDGTRRGPLALSLSSMKTIRDHFFALKRKPTDIELESLAQTWSEHCKHTIFADPLDEIQEGIYRRYIKGATEKIRKAKGKNDFCVSVFKDNSGAVAFDDQYLITHKVETHNSPSALDPFGGSITGIVGVNRDTLGFGLGAKPIANVYGFCVADPKDKTPFYRDAARRQPLLPARRILEGVIRGINAGGNQSGIPTPLGFVAVDKSFRGKPLLFAGTVGLIPRKVHGKNLAVKKAEAGDYIVMAGGRVGLDGVHGATFSSESLSSGSPATAVQIGDPITQKKLSDAIVREARDQRLYSSITDNGAGGISCSVAEMAKECGGAIVDLEKVPLKYPGLAPWQIWISESQERMTFAVPKKNWRALKAIFDRHDVEATIIGTFTASGKCIVRYHGKKIMDMDMDFLHDGRPIEKQKTKKPKRVLREPVRPSDLRRSFLATIAQPSVGSAAFISEQYDHEVQATSVTKPLQGRGRVNTDAGVLQPLSHSKKGVVLSHGYLPWYSSIDTYAMAAASIDTAIRNAVCAGASLKHLSILDNFCWSTSNTPERLYELKEAARACYDTAVAYGTPFISGKDSMFNDFRGFDQKGEKVHIAALPTLLVSALGVVDDVGHAVTIDFKQEGDVIYLIGETHDELGGSEYFAMLGEKTGTDVPKVNATKNRKGYEALSRAVEANLVTSAVSVGRGGLAVALSKSAVAGHLGARVDLKNIPGKAHRADSILFSESQGRMLVSVRPSAEKELGKILQGIPHRKVGEVGGDSLAIELPRKSLRVPLGQATKAYRSFFNQW